MGVITDIQPLLNANRQRAELSAKYKIAETPAEYSKVSVLTDAQAIAVYAQLKTAGHDTSTCLEATALAAKIKVLKESELEKRDIYDSAVWQTLSSSAITHLQTLTATDYIMPQQYTAPEQSLLLVWQLGSMKVLFFNADGLVIQRLEMAENRYRIIKVPANIYYTFLTDQRCVYLTIAPPNPALKVADWAPHEKHPQQVAYQQHLMNVKVGGRITLSTLKL